MEENVKDTGELEYVEDQAEDLEGAENVSADQTDDQEDQVDSPASGTASEDVEDVEKTGAFSTSDMEESENVEEDPETYQETVVLDTSAVDYVQQLDNIASLLLFLIFFLGIGCGLISSRIMWGQVK